MRYAQIIVGTIKSGKSTYCKLMAKYAESKNRKMRIVNLDPKPGELVYDPPVADIRDVVKPLDVMAADLASPGTGAGFEFALEYVIKNPEWLFGSIGEVKEGDYILFDFPGNDRCYLHSKGMKLFITMLVVKHFRPCGIYIQDARVCLDGYNFIGSCLTPLTAYINLSIPCVGLLMKMDLVSDDDKSKLQLFIHSELQDVLRYENAKMKNLSPIPSGQPELASLCATTVTVLDGHAMVRKKFYPLDTKMDDSLKGFLDIVDDLLGIIIEED